MSEVRYITECPYCGAGPFERVATHLQVVHGKKAAEVRADFGWTKFGAVWTRFCSQAAAEASAWDAVAMAKDGVLTPFRPSRRPRRCRLRGCSRKRTARGLCDAHYRRLLRYGDPHLTAPRPTCCPAGHPWDDENTYWWGNQRRCRACGRERAQLKRQLDRY